MAEILATGDTSLVAETDLELARRMADRDASAFEELYRRYAAPAYGLALRVLREAPLAQDVVHEAFMAIWSAPEAYDPARGQFRTFFLSLVHHRAVDAVRRETRLRERDRRLNPIDPPDEDIGEAVALEADLAERRREVLEALRALPEDQRRVVELMYFEGWTQARIAEKTGVPLGTVKTRAFAAIRKLRQALT
jgi:RNA polymerase sigma-70 factor (ECF subfamily)